MSSIDRALEAPVWEQVAAVVRRRIQEGAYPADRAMPSALSLAAELGVARGTVDRALRELAREGVVRTRARRGTYPNGAAHG
jgi:DNA-binding GntR family transcriptional regulator